MQETQETRVGSPGREDPLEWEMATHSIILAWEILCIEEPGGLQAVGPQKVRHGRATEHTHADHKHLTSLAATARSPEGLRLTWFWKEW